jgi:hypothetical protein
LRSALGFGAAHGRRFIARVLESTMALKTAVTRGYESADFRGRIARVLESARARLRMVGESYRPAARLMGARVETWWHRVAGSSALHKIDQNPSASPAIAPAALKSPKSKLPILAEPRTASWTHSLARLRSALGLGVAHARGLIAQVLHSTIALKTALTRRYESADFRGRIARVLESARAPVRMVAERYRPAARLIRARVETGRHRVHERANLAAGRAIQALRTIDILGWLPGAVRRARKLKVRVRIRGPEFPRVAARIRGPLLRWHLLLKRDTRDSRFLTSISMAALSAILALGLVEMLRRFEPASSRGVSAASPSSATLTRPVAPSKIEPAARAAAVAPKVRTRSPVVPVHAQPSLPKPTEPAPTPAVPVKVRPKPHRNQDEDYVAKDTYVYYGQAGKPSRQ